MWRSFILGTWSIQPFCWDLLHSVVSHHLSLHLLAIRGQHCISIYILTGISGQSYSLTFSYTFLSLVFIPVSSAFSLFTIAEIYLYLQSCLWLVPAELLEKMCLSSSVRKDFYQTKNSSWWGKKGNKKSQPTNQTKNPPTHQNKKHKHKGSLGLPFVLAYCSSQRLPFLPRFACFFPVFRSLLTLSHFNFPHCFFPI